MIIESIYEYLSECPILQELSELKVDFLPKGTCTVSVEPTPTQTINAKYINGDSQRQYEFLIATRFDYTDDNAITIDNSGFFERLQSWFEEQTEAGNLPNLGEGKRAESIEALSSGYLFNVNENIRDARYQIQCVLRYYQKGV